MGRKELCVRCEVDAAIFFFFGEELFRGWEGGRKEERHFSCVNCGVGGEEEERNDVLFRHA